MLNNSPDNWAKCGWSGAASGFIIKDMLFFLNNIWRHTHPCANVDVVGFHLSPQVLADSFLSEELLQKLGAVFEVVATNPPLPRLPMLDAGGIVTRAPLHASWAARLGEGMG